MVVIRFLLAALLVFVVLTVVSFIYLPWWGALIAVTAMLIAIMGGLRLMMGMIGRSLGRAMIQAFEIKAQVLKGATAEVHTVQPVPTPPPASRDDDDVDEESDDDDEAAEAPEPDRLLAYYRIDFTLTPAPAAGPMTHWDIGDLCVVDSNAPSLHLDLNQPDGAPDPGEGFHLCDVKVHEDGQLTDDEQGKYQGTRRLNVLVGVPPELRELKFRYYTEQFGRIVLPSGSSPAFS